MLGTAPTFKKFSCTNEYSLQTAQWLLVSVANKRNPQRRISRCKSGRLNASGVCSSISSWWNSGFNGSQRENSKLASTRYSAPSMSTCKSQTKGQVKTIIFSQKKKTNLLSTHLSVGWNVYCKPKKQKKEPPVLGIKSGLRFVRCLLTLVAV